MAEEDVTELERDLAALLKVEPSARFAADVRGRVAPARVTRVPWTWLSAAAALILALAAIAIATRDRTPRIEVATTAIALPAVLPVETVAPAPPVHETQSTRIPAVRAAHRDPEVLVDPEVGRAVQRLFRMVQTKQADAALARVGETPAPSQGLEVAPVVVDALSVASISGTERR